jgi:hypothetical protein
MFAIQMYHSNFINYTYFNFTFETRNDTRYDNGTTTRNRFYHELEPCTLEHWNKLKID